MIPKVNRSDIENFLNNIKGILEDDSFDIDNDFFLIKSKKEDEKHSTPYTMVDLDFDVYDVVDTIRKLNVEDFSEIKMDEDDPNPPLLYVFGTTINGKTNYIKIKCRINEETQMVICVSFHYAAWEMKYPFKAKKK